MTHIGILSSYDNKLAHMGSGTLCILLLVPIIYYNQR